MTPHLFTGRRIERERKSRLVAGEDHTTLGAERAGHQRVRVFIAPPDLPGCDVDGRESPVRTVSQHVDGLITSAKEHLAFHERHDPLLIELAALDRRDVRQTQPGVERSRPRSVHSTEVTGANAVARVLGG